MPNPKDQPVDFDDLLSIEDESVEATESAPEEKDLLEELIGSADVGYEAEQSPDKAVDEDAEDVRIRELKAALAAPLPKFDEVPTTGLTPKQREIQELEDQLAKRNATIAEMAPVQYATPTGSGETILVHVVQDGFIALGEVWFRGQEMEFEVGSQAYLQTFDLTGKSWLDLAGDLQAQYKRWGKQYLGVGPFIGRPDEKFDDEVAQADSRRGRAVPLNIRR